MRMSGLAGRRGMEGLRVVDKIPGWQGHNSGTWGKIVYFAHFGRGELHSPLDNQAQPLIGIPKLNDIGIQGAGDTPIYSISASRRTLIVDVRRGRRSDDGHHPWTRGNFVSHPNQPLPVHLHAGGNPGRSDGQRIGHARHRIHQLAHRPRRRQRHSPRRRDHLRNRNDDAGIRRTGGTGTQHDVAADGYGGAGHRDNPTFLNYHLF